MALSELQNFDEVNASHASIEMILVILTVYGIWSFVGLVGPHFGFLVQFTCIMTPAWIGTGLAVVLIPYAYE